MNKHYKECVDNVLKAFEDGTIPWRSGINYSLMTSPSNYLSGKTYNGFNFYKLGMAGCSDHRFMTFLQAKDQGFKIKKGAKGHKICFFSIVENKEKNDTFSLMKSSVVFNCSDIDGVPAPENIEDIDEVKHDTDIIQTIVEECKVDLRHSRTIKYAYHSYNEFTHENYICMPPKTAYSENQAVYNATLGHELIHWTRIPSRLNRKLPRAEEELVAELGTMFLAARLRLECPFPKHASYLNSWTQLMKDKVSALYTAASRASAAVDFIAELSPTLQKFVIK